MALDPVALDDLTWDDLMRAMRGGIPGASANRWTLHAPVDPGITILELYAALFEQRIFLIEQPCDARHRALLELLGLRPRQAIASATVLCITGRDEGDSIVAQSAGPAPLPIVPAGTVFRPQGDVGSEAGRRPSSQAGSRRPLDFSTREPTTLLPISTRAVPGRSHVQAPDPGGLRLLVGGEERTFDLKAGRAPYLFPVAAGDGPPGARTTEIVVSMMHPIPAGSAGAFSLLIDLVAPEAIVPEWLPGSTGDLPPRVTVAWSYRVGQEKARPFDPARVVDGTAGFRRPGVVRLPVPDDLTWGGSKLEAYPMTIELKVLSMVTGPPPRVRQIVPNAVIADHRRRVNAGLRSPGGAASHSLSPAQQQTLLDQLLQFRPLPGNQLLLPESDRPVMVETVELHLREFDGTTWRWTPVLDLSRSGPADRHFIVDREVGRLRFGDGLNGRLPVLAKSRRNIGRFSMSYEVGGGSGGNLEAGRPWTSEPDPASEAGPSWDAVNAVAARGGDDPESLDQAGGRAASEFKSPSRTVTTADFEEIATRTPGAAIRRALAVPGLHPDFPHANVVGSITVIVVPDVPRRPADAEDEDLRNESPAIVPDPGVLTAVACQLERARLLTQEVHVLGPSYRVVDLDVTIAGRPSDPDAVRLRVEAVLRRYVHPLLGGDDGEGWPFGGPLRPSSLMHRAQNAVPPGLVVSQVAITTGPPPSRPEGCDDVPIAPHSLVALRRVGVKYLAARRAEGVLS